MGGIQYGIALMVVAMLAAVFRIADHEAATGFGTSKRLRNTLSQNSNSSWGAVAQMVK